MTKAKKTTAAEQVAEQITEAQEAPAEQVANDQVFEQIVEAPEALKKSVDEAVLEVTAKSKQGRWRAGVRFSRTPTRLPVNDLTTEQISALKADPMLNVKEV